MAIPTYIVLHKTEWDRLKGQCEQRDEKPEGPMSEKYEYLKALNELSQEWMKDWPDTVAGHVKELEKQQRRQHKKQIELIKAYANTHKLDNSAEAIKNAKQMIFDRSSYGKKLLSALIESRNLKIRETQIKFKDKLQLEAKEQEKELDQKFGYDFEKDEIERNKKRKDKALECVQINQQMVTKKKEKQLKLKEKETQCAIESEKIMEQIHKNEQMKKEELKQVEAQGLKEYEAERKAIEKVKAQNKKVDNDIVNVHKKAQEKIKCKMDQVLKKVHQGRPESKRFKELYAMMDLIRHEKNKKFEDFVDSAIEKWEKRNINKDEKGKEEEKLKRLYKRSVAEENKLKGEDDRANDASCANKCVCDRQTILLKAKRKPNMKKVENGDRTDEKKRPENKKLSFLKPRNNLLEQLRLREKEPTSWSGARGAHDQFAQSAAAALKECQHKRLVQKVIDEYRKLNYLDEETLPIPKN